MIAPAHFPVLGVMFAWYSVLVLILAEFAVDLWSGIVGMPLTQRKVAGMIGLLVPCEDGAPFVRCMVDPFGRYEACALLL